LTTISLPSKADSEARAAQEYMRQFSEIEDLGVGDYTISVEPCPWKSYCRFSEKRIVIDTSLFKDSNPTPKVAMSVLQELGNLSQVKEFHSLIQRASTMTPDEFVSEYERIEHKSALIAKKILRSHYPVAKWQECPMAYTSEPFELHYLLQQAGGHSQEIFERHAPLFKKNLTYKGSWIDAPPSKEELRPILSILDLNIRSQDPESQVSAPAQRDYQLLKSLIHQRSKNPKEPNRRLYERLALRIVEIEKASGLQSDNSDNDIKPKIKPPMGL
jgi:hypothetical protein